MNDLPQWRWKRWDVRADGMVFWAYEKRLKNGEYWVTWEWALDRKKLMLNDGKSRRQKYKDYNQEYRKKYHKTQKFKSLTKKYQRTKKYKDYTKSYNKSRRASNPMFAMANRLRARISFAIRSKGYSKTSKTREMLGCDWNHLMTHLEEKFVDGMTWGNRHLWHIDHITPLASATSEEELIKLNHYSNLQPLWAEDNIRKGDKMR